MSDPSLNPHPCPEGKAASGARHRLRVLSYNIQVGVGSSRSSHYLTKGWKHFLPHSHMQTNLDRIAQLVGEFDVVALQETDAGSLRSAYINQTQYLAEKATFPFWHFQTNRDLGRFAQHSNGVLARFHPHEIKEFKLPGMMPGRGALMVRFGPHEEPLVVIMLHLALSKRARLAQLCFVAELINEFKHVIVMGDLNCQPHSPEMSYLFNNTRLCLPEHGLKTFPSWRPARKIDHILVTPTLEVDNAHVLNYLFSDHLPLAMDILLPEGMKLAV